MSRIIIFDDGLGQFGPMTDLRASFELRTGVLTSAARIRALRPKSLAGYWVPSRLLDLVSDRADAPVNDLPEEETVLCINGRWASPDLAMLDLEVGHASLEGEHGHVVIANLRRADAAYFLETGELHERARQTILHQRALYRHPWDILALLPQVIVHDLLAVKMVDAKLPAAGASIVGEHAVEVHPNAKIWPTVVLDATNGPIRIDDGAIIRPGVVLCGPCAIGRHSTVVDRALIKPNTVIGPVCKVGGEIGGTIMQGYTNKAHDGHLGDSLVGKWVNFGAGTTNSNLLNTYGEVSMRLDPDGPRHRTGRSFIGAIVGDHVKFAINTSIQTGSVFGTGAMIATSASAPRNVRRFAWLTDAGERTYRFEKFVDVVRTVMGRRSKEPRDAYIELLRETYDRTMVRAGAT